MSKPRPAVIQPAALGLSAGMILGALFLAVKAILLTHASCAPDLTAEECMMEVDIAANTSTFLYFFAVGLMLVGVGMFTIFRPRKTGAPS